MAVLKGKTVCNHVYKISISYSISTFTCTCRCICICICTCICTWICICIHTLIHTYAHLDAFPSLSSAIAPSKPWFFSIPRNICSLEVSESTSWLGSVLGPCDVNGRALRVQETWEPDCQSKTGRRKFPINLERGSGHATNKWVCSKNSIPRYPQFPGFSSSRPSIWIPESYHGLSLIIILSIYSIFNLLHGSIITLSKKKTAKFSENVHPMVQHFQLF